MIINAIAGNEKEIFSGGWDGVVKRIVDIELTPKISGELNVNSCINCICEGNDKSTIYVGCANGNILKIFFN